MGLVFHIIIYVPPSLRAGDVEVAYPHSDPRYLGNAIK